MYLFGSISGDIGTGGGLYPFFFVGLRALVDVGVSVEAPAEVLADVSMEDVDAALIVKIRENPTPPLPLPYLN